MISRRAQSEEPRPSKAPAKVAHPRRRFARSDGRFDLPVVTGRTPQQVARRLA